MRPIAWNRGKSIGRNLHGEKIPPIWNLGKTPYKSQKSDLQRVFRPHEIVVTSQRRAVPYTEFHALYGGSIGIWFWTVCLSLKNIWRSNYRCTPNRQYLSVTHSNALWSKLQSYTRQEHHHHHHDAHRNHHWLQAPPTRAPSPHCFCLRRHLEYHGAAKKNCRRGDNRTGTS